MAHIEVKISNSLEFKKSSESALSPIDDGRLHPTYPKFDNLGSSLDDSVYSLIDIKSHNFLIHVKDLNRKTSPGIPIKAID